MTDVIKKLSDAAYELSQLCAKIDDHDGVEIDQALIDDFQNALGDVTKAVDRRKLFIQTIDARIALAKDYRDRGAQAVKSLENLRRRTVDATKFVVANNPNIPFRDALGKQLKVIPNQPKLVITSHGWHGTEFELTVEEKVVDKEALKKALLEGKKFEFATLETGTQLRGLK